MSQTSDELLEIADLSIRYETAKGDVTAVSNASLEINEGEYYGLVGESGCGKSTLAKALLHGLDPNAKIPNGRISYKGDNLLELSEDEMNDRIRWKEIAWIPQSSMNSLDPLETVSAHAKEIANNHTDWSDEKIQEKFREMFETVGLPPDRIDDYPHQFSGGMQQRAIIALSLFLEPNILIADEPTTALDVIMQDQIFKYLERIKDEMDMSLILITHDISLVFQNCDRLAIMHSGQVAERASVEDFYDSPHHPYSILFQESLPDITRSDERLESIEGKPPELIGEVDFCTFRGRCPWEIESCSESAPDLREVSEDSDHFVACIRSEETRALYENRKQSGSPQSSEVD